MGKSAELTYKELDIKLEKSEGDMLDPPISTHPEALSRHKIIYSKFGASIEEPYYWILDHARELRGYHDIRKVKDMFTPSEGSAMFGSTAQRLGIQQDRVTQYLAQIGKFMKDLFQMVRELRILDMRIKMYEDAEKGDKTADMALKGIWVDMVEGGTKNASSVLGLSREVGFTILPDLFFSTYCKKKEDVQEIIKNLKFNEKIKEVLARKLYAYVVWKETTKKEIDVRQRFMVKYLRQHYEIIRMYMNWVRPYLTHIKRLSLNQNELKSPDIVGAFETAVIELEQMMIGKPEGIKSLALHKVILFTYNYRTRPGMEYHQDSYQHKGPIHWGRVEIDFRCYVWTKKQIDGYLKFREEEDLELLGSIDASIKAALESLGDDLKKYLKDDLGEKFQSDTDSENAQKVKEELEAEAKRVINPKEMISTLFSPVTNILNGLGEMTIGQEFFPQKDATKKREKAPTKQELWEQEKTKESLKGVTTELWVFFNVFKKGHRFLNW